MTAAAVREDPVALSDDEFRAVEALQGLVGVTSALSPLPPRPPPAVLPEDSCEGSVTDFKLQWDHIVQVTGGAPVAWGSDFQGGVDHPRPQYGPHGCKDAPTNRAMDAFDVQGLTNPGMVDPMFAHLWAMGSDRRPLDASAQRFQIGRAHV